MTTKPDGTIEFLTPILETDRSVYYRLVYWCDGLKISGYMGRPKTPGPHPAVFYNRGGNAHNGALDGTEIASLVEAGYVGAATQYRGGPGSEGTDESGGADLKDVFVLMDVVRGLSYADAERLGMMGFSRGGMMTCLVLKEQALKGTHAIKAAVTVGGVSDLFVWAEDRPQIVENVYRRHIGRTPDQDPQYFKDRSASHWPQLIDVPLLLLHGEADDRVNVRQSRRMAELLREAGKTVDLVTYPNGNHGLGRYQHGFPAALTWFQRYLSRPGEDRTWEAHQAAIAAARRAIKQALGDVGS